MAPIKFEDNIREKLEAREIEPTGDAWKKLSEKLDANSKKKSKYTIWYAIAASIIGVLIAVSVFSNRSDKPNENSSDFVDVNTSESELPIENMPKLVENSTAENDKLTSIPDESNALTIAEKVNASGEKLLPKKKHLVLKNPDTKVSEAIAKTSQKELIEKTLQLPDEVINNDELIMDKRINKMVAEVELVKQNDEVVLAEEVNSLISYAESKIEANRVVDSKKIDPASLLGDVEMEMENSFREKIFTALGDGFDLIKTAVVDRNN